MSTLTTSDPVIASRLTVRPISAVGYDLYSAQFGAPQLAAAALIRSIITEAAKAVTGNPLSTQFLMNEWSGVVDAWQLKTWEDYRDVARLGRRTRIGGKQREVLWEIFSRVRSELAKRNAVTWSDVWGRVTDHMTATGMRPYDFAVVDEAQDVSVAESRFLAALAAERPDGLFFAGDLGQRIFQQPFSWKSLGLDIRGRSFTLRINYRTSHQIRAQADRLLPNSVSDVDGNSESRRGTVSLFDGPPPSVILANTTDEEVRVVAEWIGARLSEGALPDEIGVFVRSDDELKRAHSAVKQSGQKSIELTEKALRPEGHVAIGTMHFAKGLEFRFVVVMACDDEVVPLQSRIETVTDESDLKDVYETERHLLYVACTRARDQLLVTAVDPASEFLDDLRGGR